MNPLRPAFKTSCRFIPKPKATTELCSRVRAREQKQFSQERASAGKRISGREPHEPAAFSILRKNGALIDCAPHSVEGKRRVYDGKDVFFHRFHVVHAIA